MDRQSRQEQRAKALRENLKRRKAAPPAAPEPNSPPPPTEEKL